MYDTVTAPFKIIARRDHSDVTYELEIHHPMMARAAQPGQFVIVMSHQGGERIPLTIADFDRDRNVPLLGRAVQRHLAISFARQANARAGLFRQRGRFTRTSPAMTITTANAKPGVKGSPMTR